MSDSRSPTVADVVADGNCSGCGACVLFGDAAGMALDARGDLRPTFAPGTLPIAGSKLGQYCPGLIVERPATEARAANVDPDFGVWQAVWVGHAADATLRYRGSSGGALSALVAYALDEGLAERAAVVGGTRGTRSQGVVVRSSAEAAECAASRYAPASSLAALAAADRSMDPRTLVVGRPCEASAVRSGQDEGSAPLLLSFFCAGVPRQAATDRLVSSLGMPPDHVVSLRYRGHGWPGDFVAADRTGATVAASYEDSWGRHLGRDLQSRCKICVDGVGESADVVAGDIWDSDERGYPVFDDAPGRSIIIARTARGVALVEAAAAAGYLVVTETDLEQARLVQQYQVRRRRLLAGRLAGRVLAGRRIPKYRGFSLVRFALRHPVDSARQAKGAYRRARSRVNSGSRR